MSVQSMSQGEDFGGEECINYEGEAAFYWFLADLSNYINDDKWKKTLKEEIAADENLKKALKELL